MTLLRGETVGRAFSFRSRQNFVSGAAAQADENQLHGAAASSFVAIDDNRVAAAGSSIKAVICSPGSFGFGHLAILASQTIHGVIS
jgi:hypothetical protein